MKVTTLLFSIVAGAAAAQGGVARAATTDPALAIVTTQALKDASTMLDTYVAFKRQMQPTLVVTEGRTYQANGTFTETGWAAGTTLPEPTCWQTTDVRAEAIFNWLKNNRASLNIKDLLLIGDPDPTHGDVPMKLVWIHKLIEKDPYDPAAATNWGLIGAYCKKLNDVVVEPLDATDCDKDSWVDKHDLTRSLSTDYYYSNLSYAWPKDADGDVYFISDVDFTNQDITIGRVPVKFPANPDDIAGLDKILVKFINYTSSKDTAWRKSALLGMDFHGSFSTTYTPFGEAIRNNILAPKSFSTYRVYRAFSQAECQTLPEPTRGECLKQVGRGDVNYTPTGSPTGFSGMGSAWAGSAWSGCSGSVCGTKHNFGLVSWATHGSPYSAQNLLDIATIGDYTESLDDEHPAFVASQSCSNISRIDGLSSRFNVGEALLRKGAIGFVGSTEVSYQGNDYNFFFPSLYTNTVGNVDVIYGFIQELVASGLPAGEAMRAMHENRGLVTAAETVPGTKRFYAAQLLMFNYYGDPTIGYQNAANPKVVSLPSDTPTNVTLGANESATLFADNWPSKGNPNWTANVVLSVNSLTGKPIPAGTVWVNGKAYTIGGGQKYYQELDIADKGPYTIEISVAAATTIQVTLGNR